jgi:beta-lactamase class A
VPKVISGRLGLYVARFDAGNTAFQPDAVISLNPTGQFPLASNYKQVVLLELLRQMDAGSIKASERFNVTPANQSLGYYPYDNSSALDLASRMIEWSDNTATDILHRRVGLAALQPIADGLRLCNTRLLLPTKTWWTAQAGLGGPDFPRFALAGASRTFAQASFAEQLEIAKRLDAKAQAVTPDRLNAAVETYFAGRNGGRYSMAEIDRNLQNASTPAEWARYMHHQFLQNGLSTKMQGLLRDILYRGKGRGFIRVPFKYFGGKSGNTARVLTYSGYLETNSGDRLIYVYLNDTSEELATRDQTPQAFYWINSALRTLMRPEDLKPFVKPATTKGVAGTTRAHKP